MLNFIYLCFKHVCISGNARTQQHTTEIQSFLFRTNSLEVSFHSLIYISIQFLNKFKKSLERRIQFEYLTPLGHIHQVSESILKDTKVTVFQLKKCEITFYVYITFRFVQNIFKLFLRDFLSAKLFRKVPRNFKEYK